MLHTDMVIIESMVAARQEQVAATMQESHRRSALTIGIGSLLIRVGQWLKNDSAVSQEITPVVPAGKRPQLA